MGTPSECLHSSTTGRSTVSHHDAGIRSCKTNKIGRPSTAPQKHIQTTDPRKFFMRPRRSSGKTFKSSNYATAINLSRNNRVAISTYMAKALKSAPHALLTIPRTAVHVQSVSGIGPSRRCCSAQQSHSPTSAPCHTPRGASLGPLLNDGVFRGRLGLGYSPSATPDPVRIAGRSIAGPRQRFQGAGPSSRRLVRRPLPTFLTARFP